MKIDSPFITNPRGVSFFWKNFLSWYHLQKHFHFPKYLLMEYFLSPNMPSKYLHFRNPLAKLSLQNCQEKVRATSLHRPGVVLTTAGKACLAIGIPTILLEDLVLSCFVQWFSRGEMLTQCMGPSAGGVSSEAHGEKWHPKITDGDSYFWITAAADGHHAVRLR